MFDDPHRVADCGTLPHDPRPLPTVTQQEAMDVLAGRQVEDAQYRNACQWSQVVFDHPDFIEDMPIDAKRQFMEIVATNASTRYAAIYNHVFDIVGDILEES